MYVCMYVCMYDTLLCMYVHTYVCMYRTYVCVCVCVCGVCIPVGQGLIKKVSPSESPVFVQAVTREFVRCFDRVP